MSEEKGVERFDENAALAELERLRDCIVAARRARQQKFDEFDAFVDSFRKPPSPAAAPSRVATGPAPEPAPRAPAQERAADAVDNSSAAPPPGSDAPAVDAPAAPTGPEAPSHRRRFNTRLVSAVAAATLIAMAFLAYSMRQQRATPSSAPSTPARTTPGGRAEIPAAAAPPRAPDRQAPARAVVVQLRIRRPVWMRVIIDGRKVFEGTANVSDRLEYGGDRAIVVRAGNGGDILVVTGNREEPFGEASQPVTRTFSAR